MSTFRERTNAAVRLNFLNALTNGDFDITQIVNVHEVIQEGGNINYNDESEEVEIKSATLKKIKDENGGYKYWLKIRVES